MSDPVLAERERIAAMLEVEAAEVAIIERRTGRLRNCSAAGAFYEAARLVRTGATAETQRTTTG